MSKRIRATRIKVFPRLSNEDLLRGAVKSTVLGEYADDPDTRIVDELGLQKSNTKTYFAIGSYVSQGRLVLRRPT